MIISERGAVGGKPKYDRLNHQRGGVQINKFHNLTSRIIYSRQPVSSNGHPLCNIRTSQTFAKLHGTTICLVGLVTYSLSTDCAVFVDSLLVLVFFANLHFLAELGPRPCSDCSQQ